MLKRNSLKEYKLLIIALMVLSLYAVGGFYYIYKIEKRDLYKNIDNHLKVMAYTTVEMLGKKFFDKALDKNSITPTQDLKNIKLLSKLTKYDDVKYVYTLIEKDNKIYFTSSSATRDQLETGFELTRYFDEYKDATKALKNSFKTKKMFFEESTDKWGTFRSVLIPMINDKGDWFVVGADIEVTDVSLKLISTLKYFFIYSIGMIIILIWVWFVYMSYFEEQIQKSKESEKLIEELKDINSKLEKELNQKDKTIFLLKNQ